MACETKCAKDVPVLDRSLVILVEGLERRVEDMERQLVAAAVAFKAVQEQQQVVRELLAVVAERAKA